MKLLYFLALGLLMAAGVWAQPSQRQEEAREHRRSEIRSALQAAHDRPAGDSRKTTAQADAARARVMDRHLSAQERYDLRRQLRQQHRDPGVRPPDPQH